ncbi:MAG: hypothetical protein Q9227_000346 [Pyrenula ochraceoflavens]
MSTPSSNLPSPPPPFPTTLSLQSKSAIVTGSSRGIGRVIALTLASRGANIALHYTSPSSEPLASSVASEIHTLYPSVRVCTIRSDTGSPTCGHEIVSAALSGLDVDKLDILVNNAAIGNPTGDGSAPEGIDLEDFEKTMNVNVRGPLLVINAFLQHVAEKGGRIVNISSQITGFQGAGPAFMLNYGVSKAALEHATRMQAGGLSKRYFIPPNDFLSPRPSLPPFSVSTYKKQTKKAAQELTKNPSFPHVDTTSP